MSEQVSHNPEQDKPRPLFDKCKNGDCGKKYQVTAMNTELFTHSKQPDCDYIICKCPKCEETMLYYIDEHWRTQARLNGIHDNTENEYAEDWVYERMLRARGIELVEELELTDRHEKLIENFGSILRNCPDNLLYDFITDEGDKPHPQRWV